MTAALEQMLTANGLRHHVVRWGDRPIDVVLCHGFLDIAWSFDAVARAGTAIVNGSAPGATITFPTTFSTSTSCFHSWASDRSI